ncbi:MAG: hypothetical protein A2X49_05355 [Lentisphaerae bacterium GWF2_52_8]|nr:MAG: hypothetical protein A2X49_05355 [Lentisphaerae bacterium GWF2_52_8]
MPNAQLRRIMIAKNVVLLFAAFMLGASLLAAIREWAPVYFNRKLLELKDRPDPKNAAAWLSAVREDNFRKAILASSHLVEDDENVKLPQIDYLRLMEEAGFKSPLLTEHFSQIDFLGWRSAWLLQGLAEKISRADKSELAALLKAVSERVRLAEPPPGTKPAVTPFEIWERGWGDAPDRARLLCALALQRGYMPMIAAFRGKNDMISGFLCEFRKGSELAVADPRGGTLWEGLSIESLLADPDKIPPELKNSLGTEHVYLYPAELQDYRRVNGELQRRLLSSGAGGIPVFGREPSGQLESYLRMSGMGKNPQASYCVTYWRLPIAAAGGMPGFPQRWRKTQEKAK